MQITVSIIIPVYNSEKYIEETIQSCLDQSYKLIEIIIVNDGSNDNSEEVIKRFQDKRIKYFKINNSGPCFARNYGIEKAQGNLFQFLDADDILDIHKLERQVHQYKIYGDQYVYSCIMGFIIKGKKKLEPDFDFYYKDLEVKEYFKKMFKHFGKYLTTGIWMIPRKLLEETHGWDQAVLINNDGEYFSRLILASKGIVFSPGAVFYYRRDVPESLSKKFHSKRIYKSWLYSYTCYVKTFKANLDEVSARELGRRALSVYYCNSYPHYPDLLANCKEQIRHLGFISPAAHGGKVFKIVSLMIGTDNALFMRTFKNQVNLVFNRLINDSLIQKKH